MRFCKAQTKDKKQCKAAPVSGSVFCISHDPQMASLKASAVRKGGQSSGKKKLKEIARVIGDWYRVKTARQASEVAELCVNLLLTGRLDASTAMAVHNHLNTIIKAREQTDLEKRIESLEEKEQERFRRLHA